MPFIQYKKESGDRQYYEIPTSGIVIFGREEHVDFQLDMDPAISREHFALEQSEDGKVQLIDLGGANGTCLNGQMMDKNATVELMEGDEIKAGEQSIYFYKTKPIPPKKIIFNNIPPEPVPKMAKTFGEKMKAIIGNRKKF